MCSITSASVPSSSTTWAASVPMDLAEAITAAVGVQPVPQLPPKQNLPAVGTGLQMAPCVQQLAAVQHEQQAASMPAPSLVSYPVDLFPVRRPTPAEVRATSPPATDCLQQELCSNAVTSGPLFDNMDSLQQQHSALEQLHSVSADADAVALAAVSAAHSKQHTAPLSQQQQHQLLTQLWSELQSPKAAGVCDSHPLQLANVGSGMLSDLSNTAEALQPSSSCSSEGALDAAALAAVADTDPTAAAAPDSPCSSVQSKALSTCSTSSSKKRVSWGAPVVHELPPVEPPSMLTTMWHQVQDWWSPEHADWEDSSRITWSPTVVTTTALVSLAAAAGVATLLAHRTRSN